MTSSQKHLILDLLAVELERVIFQYMVGYRNSYLPTPDGEFVFEHFLRIVDGSGIIHLNMPLYK